MKSVSRSLQADELIDASAHLPANLLTLDPAGPPALAPAPALPGADSACTTGCPVARAASVIDGRWTTLIIRDLLPGKRRYSELLASLGGISPKVLAERLRFLEAQGVVHKTTYPVVPPKTEYELTATGRQLEAVIQAMAAFGASLDAAEKP